MTSKMYTQMLNKQGENMTLKSLKVSLAIAVFGATMASAAVVATVNGKEITGDKVAPLLAQLTQGRYDSLPNDKKEIVTKRAIEQLINQNLVDAEAKNSGIYKSGTFKKRLEQLLPSVKAQLASDIWIKKQYDSVKVTDKEIKAYYDEHKADYKEPIRVHARHILVKTEKEAKDIISGLKSKSGNALKEAFISEAKAKSTGPSGKNGGDLGFFAQGQMVPAFNDAAFKMKKGTITKTPVKTNFGFHVIYLEDKKAEKKLSFKDVKDGIAKGLHAEKFKKVLDDKMRKLKLEAKIVYK